MKIAAVVNELKVILQKENCLVKSEVNSGKAKLVEEIVFLLALNCEYQEEFEVADSEHLMGMNFKLSKCLFANVITELNLISSFGNILEKLPLRVQTELLEELAICLKKATAASSFLVFVIDILSAVVKQVNIIDIGDNKKVKVLVLTLKHNSFFKKMCLVEGGLRKFNRDISKNFRCAERCSSKANGNGKV